MCRRVVKSSTRSFHSARKHLILGKLRHGIAEAKNQTLGGLDSGGFLGSLPNRFRRL